MAVLTRQETASKIKVILVYLTIYYDIAPGFINYFTNLLIVQAK